MYMICIRKVVKMIRKKMNFKKNNLKKIKEWFQSITIITITTMIKIIN